MSDTSLVFNVLGRERVAGALGRVASLFRSAGQSAERATRQATQSTERLDREIHDVERSLAALNAEFAATGNKEIFARIKRDRGLLTQLRSIRDEVGRANEEIGRTDNTSSRAGAALSRLGMAAGGVLASGLSSVGSGLVNLTTNVWNLIPAAMGAAAGLAALGPAAYLAGGAIGSLPAIIAGAAAALAVFKLGFMGLGEAYKAATTASGGGAKAARDMTAAHRAVEQAAKGVARAERDVAEAQRAAQAATLAVAAAVVEERKRRGELTRDLLGARLDQEEAADAVQAAEEDLAAARARGASAEEIDDLDRAYRRAQATLANSKARVGELANEQKKAATTGVAGSDLVVAAKERERQAIQRVKDAQEAQKESVQRLADAQKALTTKQGGGGGGGGIASPKLAASAQKFLNVILALRPAFERLRLNVQEKLFAGLAARLQKLATAWLPQLNTSLGRMADTFNGIAKKFMDTASKPKFIENVATGVEGVRSALEKVGKVAAGPLTRAFGQLAAASKPFVEAIGTEVAGLLSSFSAKIDKLSQGGKNSKLSQFFRSAADVLHDTFRMFKAIGSIAGTVMGMIFGPQVAGGTSAWKGLAATLESVAARLKDPETQAKIREWAREIKKYGGELVGFFNAVKPVIGATFQALRISMNMGANTIRMLTAAFKVAGKAMQSVGATLVGAWGKARLAFATAASWITSRGNTLVGWVKGLPSRIASAASGMWNGIKNSFRNAINWIIGRWNNLSFSLPSVTVPLLGTIGGGRIDTPNIDYLAQGGIVPATRGGRLAVLGEGGRDEAVIPLNRAGGLGGGPTQIILTLAPGADSPLMRAVVGGLRAEVRSAGRGSVQKLLGQKGVAA